MCMVQVKCDGGVIVVPVVVSVLLWWYFVSVMVVRGSGILSVVI